MSDPTKTEPRIATYEEFWDFYVSQHLNSTCRTLHFIGTTLVLICFALAVLQQAPKWLIAAPFCGYFFAWIGHFFFEKNRPATFTYPVWSLIADFRMYRFILLGQMSGEIARVATGKDRFNTVPTK